MVDSQKDPQITPLLQDKNRSIQGSSAAKAPDDDIDEDEHSAAEGAEENSEAAIMRTEITVAIKDTAQPTFEEIKEFESFSSKWLLYFEVPCVQPNLNLC